MAALMIGEVARQVGLAPSALRYYERAGLLPSPPRASKRRQYDLNILGRIRIILLARDAGFSVSETRTFLNGFPATTMPALRWREMAKRKIAELDELLTRVAQMKLILNASFHCECRELQDCERLVAAKYCRRSDSSQRMVGGPKNPLQRTRAKRARTRRKP
jgi:MerR family transcriptional regulator, redox-sensitive transcriptional activator SoxR